MQIRYDSLSSAKHAGKSSASSAVAMPPKTLSVNPLDLEDAIGGSCYDTICWDLSVVPQAQWLQFSSDTVTLQEAIEMVSGIGVSSDLWQ